ncbi:hypothetical protein L227DRAFT_547326 [Lentinus tigrinus ALCF2SS1-6]|uniref:Meiotically up-regulated protein Msb1/Mug8 domain-containing protein n=1 Tax=Lentinus tigrinus ALCF2SS1-6 TaxID=1328759 RepID=A0A5C2SCR1_9APHY|nr:hypothetical protein L227DRAFT_547326 [Lentinus tigrinus ALCF2SS1-6]
MASFLHKVFPRKKDKDATNKRNSASSLLEGKFEAVSPTVSPSAAQFAESAQQLKERGREKEKEKEGGFSLFRPRSRPMSPPPDTRKTVSNAPHLTLNLPVPKEERSRALGVVFEADPNDTSTLPENVIGERRLNPLEALLLVKACSTAMIDHGGLETLGVMHPFWYSASPEVQRKLISLFILSLASKSPITTLSPSPTSVISDFNIELEYTRSPHDIAAVLRWALRHLRLEGESFGRTTDQWKWYQTFVEAERASSYPPSAFTDSLVPQLPPSHQQLLVATLEIVSSLASRSEHNGISGSKLSKFFGLWLLTTRRAEDGADWSSFYSRWERAGRVLEHLFLAYIRDEMARKKMPLRLAELVKGYPYHNRSPSTDTAATVDDELLPRPRFSTRQYSALFVRVDTELPDAKAAKSKPHPLRIISEAFKSELELTNAQYQVVWEAVQKAALTSDEPEPILMSVDGFPSLSRVFADETTRLLSFVPAETGASSAPTVPTIRVPRPPRRRTSSLNSPTQPQTNGDSKASTNGTASRNVTSPTSPTSPSSPKDWMDFSTSGFGESTLGKDFAKTLLDKDVEVTTPPAVERKTSRRRKPSPRRSSVDNPDPGSATRAAELPGPKSSKSKSTIVSLIKLDEAFVDFWSDALTDPISSDWPNFVVAQLKPIPGAEIDGKPVGWLVLEQRFLPPPPPPATSEESTVSPSTTRRPSSPKPSIRSELSQRRVSTTLSAMKKRFTFASSSQTITGVTANADNKTVARKSVKGVRTGEMGEILPEVEEKPEEKKGAPEKTEEEAAPTPVPKSVEEPTPAATQPTELQKAPVTEPVQEATVPPPAAASSDLPSPIDVTSPLTPTADDFPAVPVVGGLLAAAPTTSPDAIELIHTEDAVLEETPVVAVPEEPAVPVDMAAAAPEEKALPPAPEHVVLTGETPGPQVALSTSEPAALAELSKKVDEIVQEAASPEPDASEPVSEVSPADTRTTEVIQEPVHFDDDTPTDVVEAPVPEPEAAPVEPEAPAAVEEPESEVPAPAAEEVPAPVEETPAAAEAPVVEEVPAPAPSEAAAPAPAELEPAPVAVAEPEAATPEAEPAVQEAPVAEEVSEPVPAVEAAPIVEEEAVAPASAPAVEETPAPEPEPIVEAPVPEPEPVVDETPAPASEPVVEEAPAPEPEPAVEEAPAPEPEPVVEEALAPGPEPAAAVEETPAEPEAPVPEETPAVEEAAAAPDVVEPEAPVEEASAPAEPTPEEPAAPVEEVKEEIAEPEPTPVPASDEPTVEEQAPEELATPAAEELVVEDSAPAPIEEPAHEESASVVAEAEVAAPHVAEEPAQEESHVESGAPAEVPAEEAAPAPAAEEPAALAETPEDPVASVSALEEKHAEEPAAEEKHENGAAQAEEKPIAAEESQ